MMRNTDYEYRDLIAETWDFLRGDTSDFPDRGLYRDVIRESGEPVLVVGCGTGRLLLEYKQEGLDVDGVDNSPEMLNICQAKAEQLSLKVSTFTQGMEELDLTRKYQTIIVPSSAFQLVPESEDAKRALSNLYQHLLPGGSIIMSIWHLEDDGEDEWGDWWLVVEMDGFEQDKSIKKWERSRYDPSTMLRHTETRFEVVADGEVMLSEMHRRSPELRNYEVDQLRLMLETAGFFNIRALSGFSREPATKEDELFCMLAEKGF